MCIYDPNSKIHYPRKTKVCDIFDIGRGSVNPPFQIPFQNNFQNSSRHIIYQNVNRSGRLVSYSTKKNTGFAYGRKESNINSGAHLTGNSPLAGRSSTADPQRAKQDKKGVSRSGRIRRQDYWRFYPAHQAPEIIWILKELDAQTSAGRALHLVADRYLKDKPAHIKHWLKRYLHFHLHFTPTSSSWLNRVEHWSGEAIDTRIRYGSFASVQKLIATINDF